MRQRDVARQQQLRPRLEAIRTDHPRIFCSEADLAEIRERIDSSSEIREVYGWLLDWARSDHYYQNLWATPNQLVAACIAYRLSSEDVILDHAKAIADYLSQAEGDSWTWPRIAKGLAFAYDWLHDDLTAEERARYGKRALHAAKECYKTWRHTDFNNHQYLEYGPVLYPGIALWREGVDDLTAEQLALDGLNLLVDHFMPAHEIVGQGDGGWHESMGYHAFFTYEFAHLIEAWASASSEDLWSDYTGLDGEAAWHVYCNRPFDEKRVSVADIGGRDAFGSANAQYLVILQRRRQDGLARYWTDRIKQEAIRRHDAGVKYSRDGSDWWPYLLWYDTDVPVVKPEELPTSRLFRGIGWVSMRSEWSQDATFALFVCSPLWLGGHQHADSNSFVLHKQGLLALDSGVYEGNAHRANYYARTIAHNTITVFDPDEQFSAGTWGYGRISEGSNDGGQLYDTGPGRVSELSLGDAYHRGRLLAYHHTPEFTYVVGDATRSYSEAKVNEFTRAFLYLPPDRFVIFDRVEATQPEFAKTWLLHTAQEPRLGESAASVSNEQASLTAWTLWPAERTIGKVGGPGHEFEVDGRNYPPQKRYDADEAGRWRVEVRHEGQATRQYFLHVLQTSDASERSASAPVLIKDPGVLGVDLGGGLTVRFATEGLPTATLQMGNDADLTSLDLNLVED